MAVEVPSTGRATVANTPEGMEIIIPSKRYPVLAVIHALWLILWVIGLVMVSERLMNPKPPDNPQVGLVIWLVLWIIGGLLMLWNLMWQLVGREIITLNGRTIRIRRQPWLFGGDKEYAVSGAENFKVCPDPLAMTYRPVVHLRDVGRIPKGTVRFDYGKKTVTFGLGLDEVEAVRLIKAICDRGYIRTERTMSS